VESFIVDLMLLRLGRWLRLMGQDVASPKGCSDEEILQKAKVEKRTLLTRDKRLATECLGSGVKCILIKSSRIDEQIEEMAKRGIPLRLDPKRCTICNGLLQEVELSHEIASIEPSEKKLWRCSECQKLYWKGSHWRKIKMKLDDIASRMDLDDLGLPG